MYTQLYTEEEEEKEHFQSENSKLESWYGWVDVDDCMGVFLLYVLLGHHVRFLRFTANGYFVTAVEHTWIHVFIAVPLLLHRLVLLIWKIWMYGAATSCPFHPHVESEKKCKWRKRHRCDWDSVLVIKAKNGALPWFSSLISFNLFGIFFFILLRLLVPIQQVDSSYVRLLNTFHVNTYERISHDIYSAWIERRKKGYSK